MNRPVRIGDVFSFRLRVITVLEIVGTHIIVHDTISNSIVTYEGGGLSSTDGWERVGWNLL